MSDEDNYGTGGEDIGFTPPSQIIAQAVMSLKNAEILLLDALYLEYSQASQPLDSQKHLQLSSLEHIVATLKGLTGILTVVRVQSNLTTQINNNWNT